MNHKLFGWILIIFGVLILLIGIFFFLSYDIATVDGYRNVKTGECVVTSFSHRNFFRVVKYIPEGYIQDISCR